MHMHMRIDALVLPRPHLQDSAPPTKGEGPGQAIISCHIMVPAITSLTMKRGVASWPSAI